MNTTTRDATAQGIKRIPIYLWLLAAVGALAGALLAEPGDFWGNMAPSIATFAVVGAVLGAVCWGIGALVRRASA